MSTGLILSVLGKVQEALSRLTAVRAGYLDNLLEYTTARGIKLDRLDATVTSTNRSLKVYIPSSSGNWQAPAGVYGGLLTLIGSGGGGAGGTGGNASTGASGGGGGGAGGILHRYPVPITPGTIYAATVGAGGAGGAGGIKPASPLGATASGANGTAGGATTFLGYTANGGGGGLNTGTYIAPGIVLDTPYHLWGLPGQLGEQRGYIVGTGYGGEGVVTPVYSKFGGHGIGPGAGGGANSTNAGGGGGGGGCLFAGGSGGAGNLSADATNGSAATASGGGGGGGGGGSRNGNGGNGGAGAGGRIILEYFG